jgi:hypothetical protein
MGHGSTEEFIKVLCQLERFVVKELTAAVSRAATWARPGPT